MNNNFSIAKNLLEQNGEIVGATKGDSMRPLFRDGKDRAVIIPLPQKIKPNDVLLYKKNNSEDVVLHRIIKVVNNMPVFRGDALYFREYDIPRENILGIMKGFYRGEKYYDCKKSLKYKLYVFYIRVSYPLRRFGHKVKSFFKILKRKF